MSMRDEARRQSNTMSFAGGSQSRASSLQKITGPEKKYTSLFIFTESNPFRRLCRYISESKVSFQ